MFIPQAKAKGALLWWGKFRFMYNYAQFYIGMIQLMLIAIVAYNTTMKPWLAEAFGWNITLWQYCVALGVLLIIGMVLEFSLGVPALVAVSNEQMYKHDSPIKTDFIEVKDKQKAIEAKLDKVMEHLGIE